MVGEASTRSLSSDSQGNALHYHLIALNAQRVALYTGIGDEIQEVPLPDVSQSLGEDLQTEEGPRGARLRGSVKGGQRVHYGQSGPKEHAKADLEKFFRIVAKELWKNHLRASTKPVILAAPSHHQPIFRKVAQMPTLIEAGISVDPAKMSPDELKVGERVSTGDRRRMLAGGECGSDGTGNRERQPSGRGARRDGRAVETLSSRGAEDLGSGRHHTARCPANGRERTRRRSPDERRLALGAAEVFVPEDHATPNGSRRFSGAERDGRSRT